MIAIHLGARTVRKKELGLAAGGHLRTVRAAIADVAGRRGGRRRQWQRRIGCCSGGGTRQRRPTDGDNTDQPGGNQTSEPSRAPSAGTGSRPRRERSRSPRRRAAPSRPLDPDGPRLAIRRGLDVVRHQLARRRTHTIAGERRDVHEQIRSTTARRNEAEATRVVPAGQCAVGSHAMRSPGASGIRMCSRPPYGSCRAGDTGATRP